VGKKLKVLVSLIPLLGLLTAFSVFYVFKWKKDYGRVAREKRQRTYALPFLEQARDLLAQADRYARLPDAEPGDVRDRAEEAEKLAARALSLLPEEEGVAAEEFYRARGQALEMQYNFEEARADYEAALARHPEAPTRFLLGLLGVRELARAKLADLRTALEKEEVLVGRAVGPLRRFQAPSPEFQRKGIALEIPMDYQTLCTLSIAYALGEYEKAAVNANAATGLDRTQWMAPYLDGLASFELGKHDEAAHKLQAAVRIAPGIADAHAWLGRTLARLGRRADAIASLTLALAANPHFLEAWWVRGGLLFEDGRFGDSREDFEKCTELRPNLADPHLKLGIACWENWQRSGRTDLRDLEKAAGALTSYLNLTPREPQGLILRARVAVAQGDLEKAQADLALALSLAPAAVDAMALRAELHEARHDWAAAEKEYDSLLEKSQDPGRSAQAQRRRARVRAQAGRTAEALADLDALLARDPNDLSLYDEKARLLRDAKRPEEALAETQRGLAAGRSGRLRLLRAEIRLEQGDAPGAVEEATQALSIDAQLADALVVRGRAYLRQDQKARAAADWKRALELSPGLRGDLEPMIRKAEEP
jgi:tetratricopeptide (TPR) repeat protein